MTSTTRPMRTGESEGNPYNFVSQETFEAGIHDEAFLEHAKTYNGQYYGVTHAEMQRVSTSGKIGVWKMDWRGVETAKKKFPTILAILITAPLSVLETRIRNRDNPSEEFIRERMNYTREFLKHTSLYDFVVENEEGKLDATIERVKTIIESHLEK